MPSFIHTPADVVSPAIALARVTRKPKTKATATKNTVDRTIAMVRHRPAEAGHYTLRTIGSWESGVVGSWASGVGSLRKQVVQMEMMLPELAAVIARGNLDDTRPARRGESGPHRLLDRRSIESIHDDLQH